ncbi:hypothetical protein WDW89_20920 [Deltaproteobacteria bacterium TL4]
MIIVALPGIDGMSVENFPALVRPKWKDLKQQILAGVYFPQPSKRVEIPKASGGVVSIRQLWIKGHYPATAR